MSKKSYVSGPVKDPLSSYPKLWRLLDHYFLKEDVLDKANVEALDTLVDINSAVLQNPKSVNLRAVRSSEPRARNLIQMGGSELLTEIGWQFKVMRMEECWVLPYDMDLEALAISQAKLIETQMKIKERYTKQLQAISGKAQKDKAEKLQIMKQIENDRLEREHRNNLRAGVPPKPTQSLDGIRKQAVKERIEREKAKKSHSTKEQASQGSTNLPGAFPEAEFQQALSTQTSSASPERSSLRSAQPDEVSASIEMPRMGGPTGGRSARHPGPVQRPRKKGPVPIEVKKVLPKETYQAGSHKLGGTGGDDDSTEDFNYTGDGASDEEYEAEGLDDDGSDGP